MGKVLISFLGTGRLKEKESTSLPLSQREYYSAKYNINGHTYETPFVAAALTDYYNVDRVYMIGTVHSMWEEVYRYYNDKKSQDIDEELYLEIGGYCERANHTSELSIPHKNAIEDALGNGSKIMLINYGLTQEEIHSNTEIILQINDLLNQGDELIVDVSHSFRSLPILIMNLLIYVKHVSRKSIKISHIHYGMLEVRSELGYAPIVDLCGVLDVNDWITSAVSFQEFGNVYKMVELLKPTEPALAKRLDNFSKILSLNHLSASIKQYRDLDTKVTIESPFAKLIVQPILKDFVKEFRSCTKDSQFQFKLAEWQFKHKNYLSSYASLVESCLTMVCDDQLWDWTLKENRDNAKKIIGGGKCNPILKEVYKEIKEIRNALVHCNQIDISVVEMIKILRESIEKLTPLFK